MGGILTAFRSKNPEYLPILWRKSGETTKHNKVISVNWPTGKTGPTGLNGSQHPVFAHKGVGAALFTDCGWFHVARINNHVVGE